MMIQPAVPVQPQLSEAYTGALATAQIVGRQDVFRRIRRAVRRQQPAILYLVGLGGVGKTRLLKHVLEEAKEDKTLLVADELIDLYHIRNRSVGGLVESLLDVVKPLGDLVRRRSEATTVDDKLAAFSHAELEGLSPADLIDRRRELTQDLLETLNQFTQTRRLVLALDTAERLFITPDEAQRRLGLTSERPAILDWLLEELLPRLHNSVVLVAGRPAPLNLTADLRKAASRSSAYFAPLVIEGLSEAEALAYFDAVVAGARSSPRESDRSAAAAIGEWTPDERRTIFYCLHDGGDPPRIRPILLALAIDHLVIAGRPLDDLRRPLAEAQTLDHDQRRAIEGRLGMALVQSLHEYRRPADEVILALAWLRKGADAALLSVLTGAGEAEITEALQQIRDLSFVKIRPADQRFFLHDEIYDLLQRYVLEPGAPIERERIFRTLKTYNERQINIARLEIDELYRPLADTYQEILPDATQVRQKRARLQDTMVENLYYLLRWRPGPAFQVYCLYAQEALSSGDEILWTLLRAELFGFLAERDPEGQAENIDGLLRADVVADSAVRWVMWLFSQERYDESEALAERLHSEQRALVEPGGELALIHLDAWRGFVLTYTGKNERAEQILIDAIGRFDRWLSGAQRTVRAIGVQARLYNGLGYLYSRQTRHYEAVDAFAKAVQLWEAIRLTVEQANSLNNRAFDIAKLGQFHVAVPMAKRALELREQVGPRAPVGLSVNTLARIELAQFDLAGAVRDSARAMEIFRRLNSPRGLGLALIAHAEAKRRTSASVTIRQQGRSAQLLEEAAGHIREAVEIFSEKIIEPGRQAEAWREQGRIYRDWAKLRRERPNLISWSEEQAGKYTPEQLAEKSEAAFAQALALAANDPSQYLDIKQGQAKLRAYMTAYEGAPNFAEAQAALDNGILAEIEALLPPAYRTPPAPGEKLPKAWPLVQAGGLALLRGHILFHRWLLDPQDKAWLFAAVAQYTRSLAFYHYFSEEPFQEVREATDQIYEHFQMLSAGQKAEVAAYVTAQDENYPAYGSRMRRFLQNRFGEIQEIEVEF